MLKLPQDQRDKCIEITRCLRQMPGAVIFNDPIDATKVDTKAYFKKIRNPQDLGTILSKLEASEYESITQWEHDVNTVWANAIIYNGEDSLFAQLAKHMENNFIKLKRDLDRISFCGWTRHIYNLRYKFDQLLSNVPPSLSHISSKLSQQPTYMIDPLTSNDMTLIIEASKQFNSTQHIAEVYSILSKNDPNLQLDPKVAIVDVNNLSSASLHELKHYYQKQLIELTRQQTTK